MVEPKKGKRQEVGEEYLKRTLWEEVFSTRRSRVLDKVSRDGTLLVPGCLDASTCPIRFS